MRLPDIKEAEDVHRDSSEDAVEAAKAAVEAALAEDPKGFLRPAGYRPRHPTNENGRRKLS
jgi:hypothetical protein